MAGCGVPSFAGQPCPPSAHGSLSLLQLRGERPLATFNRFRGKAKQVAEPGTAISAVNNDPTAWGMSRLLNGMQIPPTPVKPAAFDLFTFFLLHASQRLLTWSS